MSNKDTGGPAFPLNDALCMNGNQMISGNLLCDFLLHSEDFAVCQWDDNIDQWIPIPLEAALREAEAWDESQKDDYTE